ncbi:hypothetical protein BDU57DRAFT_521705 [Ampelomyces quisqualis]|uniref:Uncharacterized protein n=1 Tax=Ampelomyces quisqualis TaxID=50730 RepID=A0A6A5QG13_AMPQU|nr:hypothetical protein BDU57DRAFT_521705 [Ampelomyces quisqualis]
MPPTLPSPLRHGLGSWFASPAIPSIATHCATCFDKRCSMRIQRPLGACRRRTERTLFLSVVTSTTPKPFLPASASSMAQEPWKHETCALDAGPLVASPCPRAAVSSKR